MPPDGLLAAVDSALLLMLLLPFGPSSRRAVGQAEAKQTGEAVLGCLVRPFQRPSDYPTTVQPTGAPGVASSIAPLWPGRSTVRPKVSAPRFRRCCFLSILRVSQCAYPGGERNGNRNR